MFRKPRESDSLNADGEVKPSTGRPPTPPNGHRSKTKPLTTMNAPKSAMKPLTPQLNSKSNVPIVGRQSTMKVAYSKVPGKANGSILNFFKKVDSPQKDGGTLFLSQGTSIIHHLSPPHNLRSPSPSLSPSVSDSVGEDDLFGEVDDAEDRYNEFGGSLKRRRLIGEVEPEQDDIGNLNGDYLATTAEHGLAKSSEGPEPMIDMADACTPPPPPDSTVTRKPKLRRIGAFLDYSESEEEDMSPGDIGDFPTNSRIQQAAVQAEKIELDSVGANTSDTMETEPTDEDYIKLKRAVVPESRSMSPSTGRDIASSLVDEVASIPEGDTSVSNLLKIPSLKTDDTSYDGLGGFEDLEDFPDDDFVEGEEFVERRWMEEQAILEAAEQGVYGQYPGGGFDDTGSGEATLEGVTASCPICDGKLVSLSTEQASRHVNACLDGNPIPIPIPVPGKVESAKAKIMPAGAGNRFSRAATARPGQANPFDLGKTEAGPSSAFSKLMASHAEDAAWATAAAAENAARGKPAYQRTCPFYKIMPGFFICVDAFRYGAVQGCNAYFLSHFHSDHYVGLTPTWSHGPIYCSKVTGNLVKQQLRVDPKWVVPLDFEARVEIPGTQGVAVTMIPANHCPGSSLFLFEKVVGKGSTPRTQRVLHCGDFRACPAHIAHPLLMPDIVDSITGKTKQQKIDVCYLDTTYLNPRYAFPSQDDVIKACADMCVSLKKEKAEESDAWEVVKKERAGAGMAKFIGATVKSEDSIAMEVGSTKIRGRLLVICGTYSIGKERICMGIARALDCKIWAPPGKQRICAALEDPELSSRLTEDPREAQIHMQMLMEIRAETLQDYLNGYKPYFSRIVGFRPSGWNYRPPNSRFVESPAVQTVLRSDNWKSRYSMAELIPQRGSTREASCFGVPYSEHSSFRELTIFCCALRIDKIIPTVNVGSAASRAKMKAWIDRWMSERKKNGLIQLGDGEGEVKW